MQFFSRFFKTNYKYKLVIILILICFLFYYINYINNNNNIIKLSSLNKIELAINSRELSQGLMFRKKLCDSCAMLFVFNNPRSANTSFWMKNTYISLDMLFIDKDGKIVTIHNNTKPLDVNLRYSANNQYKYVLETNAGFAKNNKLRVGDVINIDYLLSQSVGYSYGY